jgi:spore coat polysaccharide biosynthesis protein SpsF
MKKHEHEKDMITGFITVRTGSSRLPRKCLLPFGNGNVLEHIIRRAKHYELEPVVCTTSDPSDDILEEISQKEGVKVFRGSVSNKMKRWLDCCLFFDVEAFHTIDADDPFFDGDQMKRSFALLQQGYDVVAPSKSSSMGGASVGYSLTRDIVARCCENVAEEADTEMIEVFLDKLPWHRNTILPEKDTDSVPLRLTLDYEEDYWLLRSVLRMVGPLVRRELVGELFRRNPDLYLINWFRNKEWKERRIAKQGEI